LGVRSFKGAAAPGVFDAWTQNYEEGIVSDTQDKITISSRRRLDGSKIFVIITWTLLVLFFAGAAGITWYPTLSARWSAKVTPLAIPGTSAYPGNHQAEFKGVATGADGSVVAVGRTDSTTGVFRRGLGNADAFIVRIGPDGKAWSGIYGGQSDDIFNAVTVQPDGTIIAVGSTMSIDGDFGKVSVEGPGAVVAAISPNNKLLWHKTLGTSGCTEFVAVSLTPNGNIVAAGQTGPCNPSPGSPTSWMYATDNALVMLSPQGDLLWSQVYGPFAGVNFTSVTTTSNGDIVAAGYSTNVADGPYACVPGHMRCGVIILVTPTGQLEWAKTLTEVGTNPHDGQFRGISINGDGNIVAVGDTMNDDCWAVALTPDGTTIWNKTYLTTIGTTSLFTSAATATDGNIIAAGMRSLNAVDNIGVPMVVMLDSQGDLGWTYAGGGTNPESLSSIAVMPDGHIVAAGSMNNKSTSANFAYLIALNSDGTLT